MATSKDAAAKPRTPRGTLSKGKILTAAVDVLDKDGLDGVTMRSVANALNVNAMSLYRHFRDKDELLLAILDQLTGQLELPAPTTPAVETVKAIMRAYYRLLLRYPGLHLLDPGNAPTPGQLRISERLYAVLIESGMDIRQAISLLAVIERFVLGCALRYPERKDWDHNQRYWAEVRSWLSSLPRNDYPALTLAGTTLIQPARTQEELFEDGISVLLAPLEALTTKRKSKA